MDKIKDYKLKHTYKANGKLYSETTLTDRVYEFILIKGSGEKKRFLRFVSFDIGVKEFVMQCKKGKRLKVRFKVKSNLRTGKDGIQRWYTDMICSEVSEFVTKKVEVQSKQQDMFDENNYIRSINGISDQSEWIEKQI